MLNLNLGEMFGDGVRHAFPPRLSGGHQHWTLVILTHETNRQIIFKETK